MNLYKLPLLVVPVAVFQYDNDILEDCEPLVVKNAIYNSSGLIPTYQLGLIWLAQLYTCKHGSSRIYTSLNGRAIPYNFSSCCLAL